MEAVLQAVEELEPGEKWQALYRRVAPGYRRWFLREGDAARPTYLACRRALRRHMPELVPVWERLVALAGGGDQAARMLSLWCPTPYLTGCSQAVWSRGAPALVRNYDYAPHLWDALLVRSAWTGRQVLAMNDSLWGALDGVNEAGVAVALAFGGRRAVGEGFGAPLILRYVLETCTTAGEAGRVLARVPSHMAYNVTVVDRRGDYLTAYLNPDRPPALVRRRVATNHQQAVEWSKFAQVTASVGREQFLSARLADEEEAFGRFVDRFLEPPLHSTRFDHGWGTLYTAAYRPADGTATFHWPGLTLPQSLDAFRELCVRLHYGT